MTEETYVAATSLSKIFWSAPTTNVDGSAFDESQYFGFTLYFLNEDGSVASSVSIPAAWQTSGRYEYPIADLGLSPGVYRIAMTVTNKSSVESDRSAAVEFTLASKPQPPFDLIVGVEAAE
jgi:hypothetical protein